MRALPYFMNYVNQQINANKSFGEPEFPHGRLISVRLFGLVYAFAGVLIACFKVMLSSFLFSGFIAFLIIFEGVACIVAGVGILFLKEVYRILLLVTACVAALVFFYIMIFERGIILYFANGAYLRLIPYPVSILAFIFFTSASYYFSSQEIRKIFKKNI